MSTLENSHGVQAGVSLPASPSSKVLLVIHGIRGAAVDTLGTNTAESAVWRSDESRGNMLFLSKLQV